MSISLGIQFPTEAEEMRNHALIDSNVSPTQRFYAMLDVLAVAETFSRAGEIRQEQLKYHARLEEEWQLRIKEFLKRHVK
jgi:hypothetical protein